MDLQLLSSPAEIALVAVLMAATGALGAWLARRREAAPPRVAAPERARDPVTGLPTRAQFEERVADLLGMAERQGQEVCALYAGLDGFRLVNDAAGHTTGDKVLKAAARRLVEVCGRSTPICRTAGDEFAIYMNAPRDASEKLARRIVEAFGEPLAVEGQTFTVGMSVGVALVPDHGSSVRIVRRAAAAMRSVKRNGGAAHAVFDPQIEAQQRDEMMIARELQHAVARRELELVYQPKIDTASLQVTAVEALLRWKHATLGLVSPARFIPIAERHGLIEPIGNWVLESALKQAADWRRIGLRMRVAINVSGFQMRQDDFAVRLEKGLKAYGLPPDRFTCEITESVAMEDTTVTRRSFSRLQAIGSHVSIDDFGTGYSSLASLRQLPAAEVKIDRAFVSDLASSDEARAIVKAVVEMARALNLRVVAEGVETEPQRDQLIALGVHEMQGYLFAKPMSARAITIWASEAPANLAQTFRPSLFKETAPVAYPPTQAMPR